MCVPHFAWPLQLLFLFPPSLSPRVCLASGYRESRDFGSSWGPLRGTVHRHRLTARLKPNHCTINRSPPPRADHSITDGQFAAGVLPSTSCPPFNKTLRGIREKKNKNSSLWRDGAGIRSRVSYGRNVGIISQGIFYL